MIYAIVGAGGKTGLLKEMAAQFRREGKSVFATTTTHMFIEKDTLCTDDAAVITTHLKKNGFVMAGIAEGIKIRALSAETYKAVCKCADVTLVEADGSKHMALKFPKSSEPVIPENTDEILVVCGLHALGQKAKDCCHRLELVKDCLGINDDTVITLEHIQKLVEDGYMRPLRVKYPNKKITIIPRYGDSSVQRSLATMLRGE